MATQVMSQNVDRSKDKYMVLMARVGRGPDEYLAVLIQDAPGRHQQIIQHHCQDTLKGSNKL